MNRIARTIRVCAWIALCSLSALRARAQQTEGFMKGLGFRKSGSAYLHRLHHFQYACNAVHYTPYLMVGTGGLELFRESQIDERKLDSLLHLDLSWQILLPSPFKNDTLVIRMRGQQVADDQDWRKLEACSSITERGKAPMSGNAQKNVLIQEALLRWEELISWSQSGRQ